MFASGVTDTSTSRRTPAAKAAARIAPGGCRRAATTYAAPSARATAISSHAGCQLVADDATLGSVAAAERLGARPVNLEDAVEPGHFENPEDVLFRADDGQPTVLSAQALDASQQDAE